MSVSIVKLLEVTHVELFIQLHKILVYLENSGDQLSQMSWKYQVPQVRIQHKFVPTEKLSDGLCLSLNH